MKLTALALLLALMTGLLGAQPPGKYQVIGTIVISGRVEQQSLLSLSTTQLTIEFNQENLNQPAELQCSVISRVWWTMLIESTKRGYVVHQANPELKIHYELSIPAFQSELVNLSLPWESPLQPPTAKDGLPLHIHIVFDEPSSLLQDGVYTDQLLVSLTRH